MPETEKKINFPELEAVLKERGIFDRRAIALFFVCGHQINAQKLSNEQFYDLFFAGIAMLKATAVEDFFTNVIFGDAGSAQLDKAGGISKAALAAMTLSHIDHATKFAERFATLSGMFKQEPTDVVR